MCPCLAATILGLCLLSARTATRSQRMACSVISIGMLAITMIFSLLIFWEQITSGVDFELQNDSAHRELWSWIVVGSGSATLSLKIGYLIDPLSSIMLVLVTTVGVAVMVYTDGYMSHDQGYVRFFAYLSLFTASMLGLVLSPNLIQVYVFWELVGMCSYLLIGFWFTRASAAYACQKAFVTNRVGDFGLLLDQLTQCNKEFDFHLNQYWKQYENQLRRQFFVENNLMKGIASIPGQSELCFEYNEKLKLFDQSIRQIPVENSEFNAVKELANKLTILKGKMKFDVPEDVQEFFAQFNTNSMATVSLQKLSPEVFLWLHNQQLLGSFTVQRHWNA